jgi:proteasome lid subunit RPN8/RPN11
MMRDVRDGLRSIPKGPIRGRFAVTDAAIVAAERLLPTFRGPDGDHEGIVFLLGFERPHETVFTGVVAPEAEHGRGRVFVSREGVLAASRAARAAGLAVLGQIHSHPESWAYHSSGDDTMVLMPFDDMLSLVVPHYARFGLRPLDGLGVHQFQDGRWVLCEPVSVRAALRILPSQIDLR